MSMTPEERDILDTLTAMVMRGRIGLDAAVFAWRAAGHQPPPIPGDDPDDGLRRRRGPGVKLSPRVTEARKARLLHAARPGLTIADIARRCGERPGTAHNWRKDDPAFRAAIDSAVQG